MSLYRKAVMAAVSGLICYAVYHFGFEGFWPEPLFYSASGALFAAGVLFPYLKYDRSVWLRGFGLIALSTLSYWSAIETASWVSSAEFSIDTRAFLAASLVGAIIVLTGTRLILPLTRSIALAVVGLPAAIIGGLFFALAMEQDSLFWLSFAYLTWHILMAVAIHVSENWRRRIAEIE